jgi:hypothetical protein
VLKTAQATATAAPRPRTSPGLTPRDILEAIAAGDPRLRAPEGRPALVTKGIDGLLARLEPAPSGRMPTIADLASEYEEKRGPGGPRHRLDAEYTLALHAVAAEAIRAAGTPKAQKGFDACRKLLGTSILNWAVTARDKARAAGTLAALAPAELFWVIDRLAREGSAGRKKASYFFDRARSAELVELARARARDLAPALGFDGDVAADLAQHLVESWPLARGLPPIVAR